jgi:hypothetical protein
MRQILLVSVYIDENLALTAEYGRQFQENVVTPMQDPRHMSQPPAQQTPAPSSYPVQSPYPYYAQPPRVGAAGRFVRLMRLLLRRVLYGMVLLGRSLRPYALTLVVAFVLLSVIGWMSWQLWGPKPGDPGFTRAESIPPAPAVLNYLQGRKTFNADLMWDSFSTEYQTSRLNAGASKATLQSQANIEKNMGAGVQSLRLYRWHSAR